MLASPWPDPDKIDGLTQHQKQELKKSLKGNISVMSGQPGTGKTYSATLLIKECIKYSELLNTLSNPNGMETFSTHIDIRPGRLVAKGRKTQTPEGGIYVCSTTGKAASVITRKLKNQGIDITATTIHSLLHPRQFGVDNSDEWGFTYGEGRKLENIRYLFFDEPPMAGTGIMHSLISAIPSGTKVFMFGDENQLAPVGHGQPFCDMLDFIPHGTLSVPERYAGRVAVACDEINRTGRFDVSPRVNLSSEFPENLKYIPCNNPAKIQQKIVEVFDYLCKESSISPEGFSTQDIQVIVPTNKDNVLSRRELNRLLERRINTGVSVQDQNAFGDLRDGSKVICTKNCFLPFAHSHAGHLTTQAYTQRYIANGDTGVVVELKKASSTITVKMDNGGYAYFTGENRKSLELAWAITGHKSQGSEWPVVIVPIDSSASAFRTCSRNWWYTVIPRASRLCILIGDIRNAYAQCRRIQTRNRKTLLKERYLLGKKEQEAKGKR